MAKSHPPDATDEQDDDQDDEPEIYIRAYRGP